MSENIYAYVVIPLLICLARICDVSLGTMRVIFISRGIKKLAVVIGFLEVLIWLLAMQQVIKNLNNALCYIAYAGGFATGTFLGMYIENLISIGKVVLWIITGRDTAGLLGALNGRSIGATLIGARGTRGDVTVVYSVLRRADLKKALAAVREFDPDAFFSVQDVRLAREGAMPDPKGVFGLEYSQERKTGD